MKNPPWSKIDHEGKKIITNKQIWQSLINILVKKFLSLYLYIEKG